MQGYEHIGALLQTARNERRLSIEQIAAALHIRPRYLLALEQGHFDNMPGLAYVKGYLKRYTHYLSLDDVEITRQFDMVAQQGSAAAFFMPHSFSHSKRIELRTALVWCGVALLCVVAWAVWERPGQTVISLVDKVPEKPPAVSVSAQTLEQVACLRPQNTLYPPCTWPEPEPMKSVLWRVRK